MPTYIDTVLKEKIDEILGRVYDVTDGESAELFEYHAGADLEQLFKSSLEHFAQMVENKRKNPSKDQLLKDIETAKHIPSFSQRVGELDGYNQALDDVLSLLTPTNQEE